MPPELKARQEIDRLLAAAGWHVCDMAQANIHAARGVAVREFTLAAGRFSLSFERLMFALIALRPLAEQLRIVAEIGSSSFNDGKKG